MVEVRKRVRQRGITTTYACCAVCSWCKADPGERELRTVKSLGEALCLTCAHWFLNIVAPYEERLDLRGAIAQASDGRTDTRWN